MAIEKGDTIEITCRSASVHGGFKKWNDEVLGIFGDEIEISMHYKDRVPDDVYRSQTMRISKHGGYVIKKIG